MWISEGYFIFLQLYFFLGPDSVDMAKKFKLTCLPFLSSFLGSSIIPGSLYWVRAWVEEGPLLVLSLPWCVLYSSLHGPLGLANLPDALAPFLGHSKPLRTPSARTRSCYEFDPQTLFFFFFLLTKFYLVFWSLKQLKMPRLSASILAGVLPLQLAGAYLALPSPNLDGIYTL